MGFREIANILYTPVEYFNDWLRQVRWSKASPICPKELQVSYDIILLAHTVEKGLSVSKPRSGFGVEKISKLIFYVDIYDQKWRKFPLDKTYGCLTEYLEWHHSIGHDLGSFGSSIKTCCEKLASMGASRKGGTKIISTSSLQPDVNFENSLLSRFSCRRFEDRKVPSEVLHRISAVALRTPSQCNRQSVKLHYYSDETMIDSLLRLQGGAEGFRESVKNLFVVTSEISAWSGAKARSQAYVDGALVVMQVLNACQSLGLGACPLNLAVLNSREREIQVKGSIPKGERLVVMIAFGYPEIVDLKVARSERVPENEMMVIH